MQLRKGIREPRELVAEGVVRVERASHSGYTENRDRLASGRLPVVLDLDFTGEGSGRTKTVEQRSSCSDLSMGG